MRGAQGQPRGPLWVQMSILKDFGSLFGRFLGVSGLHKQCYRVGAVAKTTFSAARDFDAKMVDFGGLGQRD